MTTLYLRRLIDNRLDELLTELPAVMIVGPRAVGKTTTITRRAATVISLDVPAR
jgi:predicted AAA+ superfamily ATPase